MLFRESNYVSRLGWDIDSDLPLIGDAWETPTSDHLWGHPTDRTIFHWFTIFGYSDYGNETDYMDSATTIWGNVEAYNWSFSSSTLMDIVGGRGYVW